MPSESVRERVIDVAARLLDEEGAAALSTRRLAKELGVSTMAVYTHFGSMGEVFKAVAEEAFARFADALDAVPLTDDPFTDLANQAAAYRAFAKANGHLYSVMFGGLFGKWHVEASDISNAAPTFQVLVDATARVIDAGIFRPADPIEVAYQLWTTLHGFVQLELTDTFSRMGLTTADRVWNQLLATAARGLMP
ncbi:TetR/AcrR family transcriptional regulator [Smaragdicoccus niigatensis]|uniref:TetR/AcrR family transcriptional regulator n=1 Tax=Smaragdicoccus niigatensis TaxID=359359 RepID=UPI000378196B|nr:TetR/AcrR family transcriptional regulator [Smaragdicoccus niigatensis]